MAGASCKISLRKVGKCVILSFAFEACSPAIDDAGSFCTPLAVGSRILPRSRASISEPRLGSHVPRRAFEGIDASVLACIVGGSALAASYSVRRGANLDAELEALLLDRLREDKGAGDTEVGTLVDELAELRRPFNPSRLGSGPWVVAWSRGVLAWQRWTRWLPQLGPPNRSSQDYDIQANIVVNEAQLLGDAVFVRVSGTFEDVPVGASCPVEFLASVDGGFLSLFGQRVPLPIQGTGTVRVLYSGERVRIFESRGDSGYEGQRALTVQIPIVEWNALLD
eukprot:CAMPEP_0179118134 /NCGR_PEP_ID=MMETSP0796-20121207/55533_1 /TAXON_ID=73915 /ORGANISM="Pyrodinium bahamense, Strain pbaha01" /LENGTH=280 /DNA_ID=CAMNT_0020816555 /DNA_START=49 /DNA_END=891 /DNA_ORIENTATION=-